MIKLGIIQTTSYSTDECAKNTICRLLETLGKKETDVVCLPEQWLRQNTISDFDSEFAKFKSIAKNYSLTVIPGAFYEKKSNSYAISAPVIGPLAISLASKKRFIPLTMRKRPYSVGQRLVSLKQVASLA